VQLLDLTRAIKHAAEDSRVKGLLLMGSVSGSGYSSGLAALK
jgi:hypothetical protein